MMDGFRDTAAVENGVVMALRSGMFPLPVELGVEVCGHTWVDITDFDPRPEVGWTYDGDTFSPPSA